MTVIDNKPSLCPPSEDVRVIFPGIDGFPLKQIIIGLYPHALIEVEPSVAEVVVERPVVDTWLIFAADRAGGVTAPAAMVADVMAPGSMLLVSTVL